MHARWFGNENSSSILKLDAVDVSGDWNGKNLSLNVTLRETMIFFVS